MPLGEGHLDLGLARWRVPRRVKGSQSNDMELNHRRWFQALAFQAYPTWGSSWPKTRLGLGTGLLVDTDQWQSPSGVLARNWSGVNRGLVTFSKPSLPVSQEAALVNGTQALESHEIVKRFYSNSYNYSACLSKWKLKTSIQNSWLLIVYWKQ